MIHEIKYLLLAGLVSITFMAIGQPSITHSFFVAGPQFTGIIGEQGEEIWNTNRPGARDGFVLPNGNVLVCWADEVVEYDRNKKVIFNYKRSAPEMELGTAVRLPGGNTMITESGVSPRIVEVDQQGKVILSVPLQPETDNIHMQTRMARKLPNGNYLVPHLLAFAVKEYSPTGKVVNVFRTDTPEFGGRDSVNWPFTAIRLKNGNTLVSLTHGNKVVEFNKAGNVVWKVTNQDLKERLFVDPCGLQRLPNGNTIVCSYGAQQGVRIFELTRKKEIVWTYRKYGAHEIQVLTTNGIPLQGLPMK